MILIAVNTTLSAAASALTAATVTRIRFGRPDASLVANCWMAGLVASSAGAAFLKPAAGILVGAVAGVLVPFAIDLLESRLGVDDPGGAVSVHAIAGLWGLCSVAALSDVGTQSGVSRAMARTTRGYRDFAGLCLASDVRPELAA